MHLPSILAVGLLASVASSQSPLVVAPSGGSLYTWMPPQSVTQVFFDLTVNTQVTMRSLRSQLAATPFAGSVPLPIGVSLWLTVPGVGTFVGSETIPGNWYEAAKGLVTIGGVAGTTSPFDCDTCLLTPGGGPLVLPSGSYGCVVRYTNLQPLFYGVPTVPNTFANAELSLTGGALQNSEFTSAPWAPAIGMAGWSWVGQISYANGAVPNNCASASPYGTGCNAGSPLQLAASATPRRGTTINLTTSGETTIGLGISFLGPVGIAPGIDLAFLGAPGCAVYSDLGNGVSTIISNLGLPGFGMSYPLTIPNWPFLLGAQLYGQSAWLDAAANPFGVVTSNGLELVID
ncbi:MAG: hypothetical protein JNN13_17260 [Planctomycetes bacterium]|nr:hypothetical protein [Planctomycetota bacterium]